MMQVLIVRALTAQKSIMKITVIFMVLAIMVCAMVQESEQIYWGPPIGTQSELGNENSWWNGFLPNWWSHRDDGDDDRSTMLTTPDSPASEIMSTIPDLSDDSSSSEEE